MKSPKITAILLAAGLSTRMGEDNKLLLPFSNQLVIQLLIQELAAAKINELIVVLGHEAEQVKRHIPSDLTSVYNEVYETGMTSSIQAGVRASNPNHQGIMICMCDQLFMTTDDYNHIVTHWKKAYKKDSATIAIPTYDFQRGNPVVFSAVHRAAILAHKTSNGCKGIIQKNEQHRIRLQMPNNHILLDMDTVDDYQNMIDRIGKK